jgi:hypothetical protein
MALSMTAVGGGVLGRVLGGTIRGLAFGPAVPVALLAPGAATQTPPRKATRTAAEPVAPVGPGASGAPPTLCRCGHDAAAHEHYRRGSDCGACGAQACARFRSVRPGGLRGWLRGRRGRRAG